MRRVRRFARSLIDDNIMNLGAMLAYYAVLSLFPMVLFVISLALLVVPHGVLDEAIRMAGEAVPSELRTVVTTHMFQLADAAAPRFAITGAVLAVWGASRGAIALGQALNELFDREETRSWLRRQLIAFAVTLGVAALMLAALGLLVLGPLAGHWLGERLGLSSVFDTAWTIGRWGGAALLMIMLWSVAYRFLPDTKAPFRMFSPGAIIGVSLWLGVSWLFGLFLGNVTSYEATYGTLGTVIAFLTWLWLSNMALLVGAEINDVLADTPIPEQSQRHTLAHAHS